MAASAEERLATKEDIANLRADIAGLDARLVRWMVGLMIGATVAATALATLIERIT